LTKDYLIKEYTENRKSLEDIAQECGCTRAYVYKIIKFYNLPLRDKSSARELAYDKKKISFKNIDNDGQINLITHQKNRFNEDFFNSWSPVMAWVLGIIYTDGNIQKWYNRQTKYGIGRLSITQKEPELLNKVLALMKCDAKLYYAKKREYAYQVDNEHKKIVAGELYRFNITSDKLYDQLISLGVMPNKSLQMMFPEIPPAHTRHFIRGCWDGDGSVYIEGKSRGVRAQYTCGSSMFIKKLVDELLKVGLSNITIHELKRKSTTFYIKIQGSNLKKLFHYLYDDVPPTKYLQRKYDIFKLCESP
jgi:hypothetical protein